MKNAKERMIEADITSIMSVSVLCDRVLMYRKFVKIHSDAILFRLQQIWK